MDKKIVNALIFVAGAATGAAVAWKLLKTKYEQIAQEEIESVKEVFAEQLEELTGETKDEEEAEEEPAKPAKPSKTEKPDLMEYAAKIKESGYSSEETEEKEAPKVKAKSKVKAKPYVISPDEFDYHDDYEVECLDYYACGTLTDSTGAIIENVEELVGKKSLECFGQYEEDTVYVRNEKLKTDFEICRDMRNYEDVNV